MTRQSAKKAKHDKREREGLAPAVSPRWARLTAATAAVAALVSAYLTYVHYRVHQEAGYSSLCDINAKVSCDAIAADPSSSLLGLPLAAWGAWFYAVMALIAWNAARGNRWRMPRAPGAVLLVMAGFTVLLSAALAVVSARIGVVCPFCIALYALNLALAAFTWLGQRSTGEGLAAALKPELRYWNAHARTLLFIGIPLAVLALALLAWPKGYKPAANLCDVVAAERRANKPVHLVLYSDFQCPFCKKVDELLRKTALAPDVKLEHREFPLDNACNRLLDRRFHDNSCDMAAAAICGGRQGRYPQLSEKIFSSAAKTHAALGALAAEAGLDRAAFDACLKAADTQAQLRGDIDAGIRAGVKGTPSMFVNGRPYEGPLDERAMACLSP